NAAFTMCWRRSASSARPACARVRLRWERGSLRPRCAQCWRQVRYSAAVANATYPGTVTPLRGLSSFAESERDVLFGRDRERDELARLVTDQSFRAGLLHGEPGVGKTSLLRAGLGPDLRDHGVVALFCDDNSRPIDSF